MELRQGFFKSPLNQPFLKSNPFLNILNNYRRNNFSEFNTGFKMGDQTGNPALFLESSTTGTIRCHEIFWSVGQLKNWPSTIVDSIQLCTDKFIQFLWPRGCRPNRQAFATIFDQMVENQKISFKMLKMLWNSN